MGDAFTEGIYALVASIPMGRVMTYGQIAAVLGYPNLSRKVGKAMGTSPPGLPCHRVVNASGRTAPGWVEQRPMLEAEGVRFLESGAVDLKAHRWWPPSHRA